LDVAAAADALLASNPRRLAHLARLLATTPDNARRVLVAMIALHDIGKFSDAFQGMVPDLWPQTVLGPPKDTIRIRHDQTAFDLLEKLDFSKLFGGAFANFQMRSQVAALWSAVAWHHGKPGDHNGNRNIIAGMSPTGIDAALAFAQDISKLFGPFEPLAKPDQRRLGTVSWAIAGLTNLADWIGSNRDVFSYTTPNGTLAGYWSVVRERADRALALAGLQPAKATSGLSLRWLIPAFVEPSPLQHEMSCLALPEGPMLAIVEDVTGSGKTEAALLLAGRLMNADRASGLYFALPTMATANAMFDRLRDSYRRLFEDDVDPSLVLAHGRCRLHEGFSNSILECCSRAERERSGEKAGDQSSATCAAWIADDRRKAFLAQVGVGTIDQAFLAALPTKHQALRLWALADRVLIVDEAHAYDAYMTKELHRVLEFHAALGGSAVVLSATLPTNQREELTQAFARGLGTSPDIKTTHDYPLVTVVSEGGVAATNVATRRDRARRLPVRAVRTKSEIVSYIISMADRGAAVAWIRNSVDDAIEAVEALRQNNVAATLLHARFAMGDRLKIEAEVRERLGRNGDPARRRGFVLIGTQILEQSLDYDVDAMVSDLAPIDLVIQRAGRLWRHANRRDRPVSLPELVLFAPDWNAVTDSNWYAQVSRRAAAVYRHHGLVWRSAKALEQAGAILTPGKIAEPDSVRALIESVYGSASIDDIPPALVRASNEATGREFAAFSIADANLLNVAKGYGGQNQAWGSDQVTPTRLGEPVTVFRLGKINGGQVVPWCMADDGDLRRSWALSEVSINQRKATGIPSPTGELASIIDRAKTAWPEWEHDQPLLVLSENGGRQEGIVLAGDKSTQMVVYDPQLGLRIQA